MTNRSVKKCARLSFLVLLASVTGAQATPKYDKKIADAAANQVAKRLGDLRGGLGINDEVELVTYSQLIALRAAEGVRYTNSTPVQRSNQHRLLRRYDPKAAKNVRVVYTGTIIEN